MPNKYFILIEIAIKLTVNIEFHEKIYFKIKGSQLLAHSKNQLVHGIEKMHTTCICYINHKKTI